MIDTIITRMRRKVDSIRLDAKARLDVLHNDMRMRRKIDIVRLDARARQDVLYHDMNELLSLLYMLERELDAELAKVESGLETLHQKMREGDDQ